MSTSPLENAGLQIPESLQSQLFDFRRRVWTIKSIEAVCGAVFGVTLAYLCLFLIDRVFDTPPALRLAIFLAVVVSCATVPVALHRWVWRRRQFEQLARLLSHRYPSIGDQMLGIIELVRSESEQARSRALCEAAIGQVAEAAAKRDFRDAVPRPRHRLWAALAAVPLAAAVALALFVPSAAMNAWARLMRPWADVPRYTFTRIDELPDRIVVPHGEASTITLRLQKDSQWQPERARGQLGSQRPLEAKLENGRYSLALPPQISSDWLELRVGDVKRRVRIEPMLRPELTSVIADVRLPEYLQLPQPLSKDVRSGAISLVRGSQATFVATANRNLSSAEIDGQPAQPAEAKVSSPTTIVDVPRKLSFAWKDEFSLAGREPFAVSITARDDEAPSVACEDLPRQKVVLVSETLSFKVRAQDDFGVKVVGVEWEGAESAQVAKPVKGEHVLAAGGSDKDTVELAGTFCAETLGIEPQPLRVRIFAEDYLGGRPRSYSPTYELYVLSAEQHYIWLTEQLNKWHRQSLEVRDREMQLHHANQQLRLLSDDELDHPDTRRRIESQSAAERANGRRLSGLVDGGQELVRQAMRNAEFGVGHLEELAEMLNILKDISANRMPNVADLLKESSQSPGKLASAPSKANPTAGQARGGTPGSKPAESKPKPAVPQVVDAESSQQPATQEEGEANAPGKKNSNPTLRLPVTTLAGAAKKGEAPKAAAAEKLEDAVVAQQDLLAEFDKIADELNKVLANLEGSTLVKRLKSASRQQYALAGKIADQLDATFGQTGEPPAAQVEVLKQVSSDEEISSQKISTIMDDMQAYFERRRFQRFKTVLDEMRKEDAVGSLRQLSEDVRVESGMSIAQAEFWSDTFDRWADDLVDPACAGKCPGCKSKGSLPPSIVLEAMQILEAEINLREETRVAQQARAALAVDEFDKRADGLQTTQQELSKRVVVLTQRIRELPDGEADFPKEIALLGQVETVMNEAAEILGTPETGPTAIAAETEAIELLLQSKRFNPNGGGGGGSSPGGGGTGTTSDTAIALIGAGLNDKEVREDHAVSQATGESGSALPEEFRAGLDEYFNRLEGGRTP